MFHHKKILTCSMVFFLVYCNKIYALNLKGVINVNTKKNYLKRFLKYKHGVYLINLKKKSLSCSLDKMFTFYDSCIKGY